MRRAIKRSGRVKKKFFIIFWTTLILLTTLVIIIDMQIRPIIETVAGYSVQSNATQIISDAIDTELLHNANEYKNLVKVQYGDDGQVAAVEADVIKINYIKTNLNNIIIDKLSKLKNSTMNIPIGTLIGGSILSGRGPRIPIEMIPAGFVQSQVISTFSSSGINQTVHRIVIQLEVGISAIIPGYTIYVTVPADFCIAETIITGTVPGAYTQIIGEPSNTAGKVANYGASSGG